MKTVNARSEITCAESLMLIARAHACSVATVEKTTINAISAFFKNNID